MLRLYPFQSLLYPDSRDIDGYVGDDELSDEIYKLLLRLSVRMGIVTSPVKLFHVAYYMCNRALDDAHPELEFFEEYYTPISDAMGDDALQERELVLGMIYSLLSLQEERSKALERFLVVIETVLEEDKTYFPLFKTFVDERRSENKYYTSNFESNALNLEQLNDADIVRLSENFEEIFMEYIVASHREECEQLAAIDRLASAYDSWCDEQGDDLTRYFDDSRERVRAYWKTQTKALWEVKSDGEGQMDRLVELEKRVRELTDELYAERMKDVETEMEGEHEAKAERTLVVSSEVMLILLKQAGITENNSVKWAMVRLIAYVTGYSENTIKQHLTYRRRPKSCHRDEVELVNQFLDKLNISESVSYDKG